MKLILTQPAQSLKASVSSIVRTVYGFDSVDAVHLVEDKTQIRVVGRKEGRHTLLFFDESSTQDLLKSTIERKLVIEIPDSVSRKLSRAKLNRSTFLRVWELLPLLLSPKVRESIYLPCVEELKDDYLAARNRFRTPAAKRWIAFCFTVRTASLVAQCLWVAVGAKARAAGYALLVWIGGGSLVDAFRRAFVGWFGRLP